VSVPEIRVRIFGARAFNAGTFVQVPLSSLTPQ
jgi:hypothetical protein